MAEEKKESRKSQVVQLTLNNFEITDADDSQYGHLVAHLVEEKVEKKGTEMWTRVFVRDTDSNTLPPIYEIGQDLIFNQSLRESVQKELEPTGEIVFSPKNFQAKDLVQDLNQRRLSLKQLTEFGWLAT